MPKCTKCGKSFKSLPALNDHFRAVHPNQRFVAPKNTAGRNLLVGVVIVIIVVGGLVGYLIYTQQLSRGTQTQTQSNGILGSPISSALYSNLSGVSFSTLSAVQNDKGITLPSSVSGSPPLTLQGKPELLYIGAEYCPFCAAERWAMVVALSKFGSFSNLAYMISSPTDQNISTITFLGSNYTSQYVSFVSVEEQDRSGASLQSPTSDEQSLLNQYDSAGSIPFLDIANQYTVVGAQYSSSTLSGLTWSQIASQLNNSSSPVAMGIDGTADTLITALCKVDGGQPTNVCGQSFAKLSFAITLDQGLAYSSIQSAGDQTTTTPTLLLLHRNDKDHSITERSTTKLVFSPELWFSR